MYGEKLHFHRLSVKAKGKVKAVRHQSSLPVAWPRGGLDGHKLAQF